MLMCVFVCLFYICIYIYIYIYVTVLHLAFVFYNIATRLDERVGLWLCALLC